MASQPEQAPAAKDNPESHETSLPIVATSPKSADATPNKESGFSASHWKKALEIVGGVLLIAGAVLGLNSWVESAIDKSVERKLSDPIILRKIAAQSRPALIFDANESITADMGASQIVKEIHVTKRTPEGWPLVVIIDFSRFLSNPPILTSLHDTTSVFPKRAKGFSWEFAIEAIIEPGKDKANWLYRLELAP